MDQAKEHLLYSCCACMMLLLLVNLIIIAEEWSFIFSFNFKRKINTTIRHKCPLGSICRMLILIVFQWEVGLGGGVDDGFVACVRSAGLQLRCF